MDNKDTGNQTTLNSEGLGVGNYRPQAVAGEDSLSLSLGKAFFSARDSYDWDGDSLSYSWSLISKPAGSTSEIEDSDTPSIGLEMDVLGDYEVELSVSDGKQSSTDRVRLSNGNVTPQVRAGADQLISVGDLVSLDGSASLDLNPSDRLIYSLVFLKKPIGSSASLTNSNSSRASFTADKAGDYELELTVSDGSFTARDQVLISTENIPPRVDIAFPGTLVLDQALSLYSRSE